MTQMMALAGMAQGTRGWLVWFPFRAHASAAGSICSRRHVGGSLSLLPSHLDVSPSPSPLLLSVKINLKSFKKLKEVDGDSLLCTVYRTTFCICVI